MTSDLNIYLAALLTGLISSLHCVGMCGSIQQLFLSFNQAQNSELYKPKQSMWLAFSIYHTGRILSYIIIVFLASLFVLAVRSSLSFMPLATLFRAFAGLLMIAIGLTKLVKIPLPSKLELVGLLIWKRLQRLIRPIMPPKNIYQLLLVGMVWGWLPCGLVYSAVGLSMATTNSFSAIIAMLCFGLATIPAFTLLAFMGKKITEQQKIQQNLRTTLAVFLIALGFYTLAILFLDANTLGGVASLS